jgi:hypothetical protein
MRFLCGRGLSASGAPAFAYEESDFILRVVFDIVDSGTVHPLRNIA